MCKWAVQSAKVNLEGCATGVLSPFESCFLASAAVTLAAQSLPGNSGLFLMLINMHKPVGKQGREGTHCGRSYSCTSCSKHIAGDVGVAMQSWRSMCTCYMGRAIAFQSKHTPVISLHNDNKATLCGQPHPMPFKRGLCPLGQAHFPILAPPQLHPTLTLSKDTGRQQRDKCSHGGSSEPC